MELWLLIDVRNWFFLNILIMNIQNLTKFCKYITIDMICPPSVLLTVLLSWTYLCSLIVLWRGYGQILWQFQFLQVTRTTIKCHMSSKFDQIRPCSAELAALELLKKSFTYLRSSQKYFYDMLALRWAIIALWATCCNFVQCRCDTDLP